MIILGLTGSIGMGKSTTAIFFLRQGVPVFDADAGVHRLMRPDGRAFAPIADSFPNVIVKGLIDRKRLGGEVFNNPPALRQLERILHPLVRDEQRRWLACHARRRSELVVLDVPLLFETGGDANVDYSVVVTAPYRVQRQRVLARPGMTEEKFAAILRQQLDDAQKRERADFLVISSMGRASAFRQVSGIIKQLKSSRGRVWSPGWGQE